MKLNIISEKKSPIFERKEIHAMINSVVSPNRKDVLKYLVEHYSVKPEQIKILNITSKFGSQNFNIFANIYYSDEGKTSIEFQRKRDNISIEEPKEENEKKEESKE